MLITAASKQQSPASPRASLPRCRTHTILRLRALQRLLENEVALYIEQEEQLLFPAVRSAVQGSAPLLDDMVAEHDEVRARREQLGRSLKRLDDDHALLEEVAARLGALTQPSDHAGRPFEPTVLGQLSDTVRQLDWLLQGHFTGEEDGVFLPAEALLPAETFAELARRSAALASAWHATRTDGLRGDDPARNPSHIPALPVFPLPARLPAESDWQLHIEGLVHAPLVLSLDRVRSLPAATLAADFSCEEGWAVPGLHWRGVPLQAILALAGVRSEACYVAVGSGDFVAVLPLTAVREGEPLLAYELDEAPLPPAHGGPLRLVAADVACYQSVKWVDRLELMATPAEETAKRIAAERITRR